MIKRVITYLIEAVTAGTSVLLFAAVESSKLCGIAAIVFLIMYGLELDAWEGGV